MLNPERIVIGGGVSNNHEFLFKTINAVIKKRAMMTQASMVKIVRAKLGNDAGILGAQVLVRSHFSGRHDNQRQTSNNNTILDREELG